MLAELGISHHSVQSSEKAIHLLLQFWNFVLPHSRMEEREAFWTSGGL